MTTPSPFSTHNPQLQLVVDATSLNAAQTCATYYKYSILDGFRRSGVDTDFGIMFASACEVFKKARAKGKSKEEALLDAVASAFQASWVRSDENPEGKPWGGSYETLWRCTGVTPYRNAKGNRAKCPWSHKGEWFPGSHPDHCTCGSPTETSRQWVPDHKLKNRKTLVRLVTWYCDSQPTDEEFAEGRGLMPFVLPDGTPAVELDFKMVLPWKSPYGEPYILAGYLDSIMTDGVERFITDNKTTKNQQNDRYWAQFQPNTQVDTYDTVGATLYAPLKISGVLIESAQITEKGARFDTRSFYRSDEQREEYLADLEYWLKQMEGWAETGHYPRNRKSCFMCPFQRVCALGTEAEREAELKEHFEVRKWNPLDVR